MKWLFGSGKASQPGEQGTAGTGADSVGREPGDEERERAERKFRALFENGPIGVAYHRMIYDEAGQPVDYFFIDANSKFLDLAGVDPRGQTVREAFPGIENDPFDWIGTYARVARTGETVRFEQHFEANDRWYDCVGYRYKPDHFVAAFLEITERKRAEEKLRESEAKYRTLFDAAGDAIFIHDAETMLAVNQLACERLGYTQAELMAMPPGAVNVPEHSRSASERVARVMAQGRLSFETEHQRKDGSRVPIEGTSRLVTWGGQSAIMSICRDISERRRIRDALDAESAMLASVIDNNPMSMQILDGAGRTLKTNRAHTALFGSPPPPDYSMFTDPQLEALGLGGFWERIRAGEVVVFPEIRFNAHEAIPECPDCPVWVRTVGFPILGANGKPERYALMHEDVTQQRAAEQALCESEARYRSYTDNSPIGVFLCDENGRYVQANPAATTITGYTREELLTLTILEIVPPESHEFAARSFKDVLETGRSKGECAFRHKNGDIRWWSLDAVRLSPERFMGMVADITERRQAENDLRESEEKYRTLIENLAVGVVVHGHGTAILASNAMASSLLGLTAEQMLGVSAMDPRWRFLQEDGSPMPLADYPANRVIASGESLANLVVGVDRPDRTEPTWVLCNAYPVQGPEGRIGQVVVTFADITERKRVEAEKAHLQAQLLQSQKMESLGVLAGGVAHDMNNVLGAILGVATAGIESLPGDSPARSAFQTIIQAATRGGNTVKSLLGFARQSPAEDRVLDINEVFREEIRLLERTTLAKVRLELDLAADLRPIRGDAGALTNAFLNLCVNAVAAMPENGTLTLRTRNVDNDWIEVIVEDTGIGMSPEVLDKALDPFFTTKEVGKGTGLGLSMVYRTVMAHRGQMEILSELGRGTRVMMRFPACDAAAKASGTAVELHNAASGPRALNVLAVDDDELIRYTMQALLEHMGHAVTIASSGEEAVLKLEGGLRPDVIILDLNMPGLGGVGTLPRLRALNPTVPVLLATGRVDQFALDLARTQPHVTLLAKPFSMGELRERLEPIAPGGGVG